jgi:ring-1,2-phenylacetyl-CoA epoxidase subunit PaaE
MPPNGSFHPRLDPARSRTYLAIAAGSGITPILSIVSSVLAAEPDSRVMLLYANRSLARCMFADEILALKNRHMARFDVQFLFTAEPSDQPLLNGRLGAAKLAEFAREWFDPRGVDEYYLCVPGSMSDEISSALRALGAGGEIHVERFGIEREAAAVAPKPPAGSSKQADVAIIIDGRRRSFTMPMDGEVLLDAAERAGMELPFSCRAGICSTCRAKVLSGKVSMGHNQALEDWEVEAGYILCCQSHPLSPQIEITFDDK